MQGFEAVDVLTDGRRGHAQRGSGGVHAAVFEDGGKNEQGFDVLHGVYRIGIGVFRRPVGNTADYIARMKNRRRTDWAVEPYSLIAICISTLFQVYRQLMFTF